MNELDEARWQAVSRRDENAVGVFFYAVTTTGIYCQPTCPSRRPRRENITYFATAADAVAAGFRACRRCRPDAEVVTDPAVASVIAVCRWIENPDDDPDLAELADRVGWSQRHLRRVFTDTIGVTITAYRRAQRSERARSALRRGVPVTEAVFGAGYGSMRAFYDHGANQLGSSPDAFRRGSPGADVAFSSISLPLGEVVVAATARGVCAVRIGDDPEALISEIAAEFPEATIARDDEALLPVVALVGQLAEGRPSAWAAQIPLDLRGSAFQVAVWEALRSVESGTVVSYAELADRIGRPGAHRAVGSACAANPVALLVPCHRVVRRDGGPGGYRWGPERKRAILTAETARASERT